jgi:PleD family two-component response regulator
MGGTINLSSIFGEGTNMTVTLPFEKTPESEVPQTIPIEEEPIIPVDRENVWILLVEDNELNREFFHKCLQRMGFSVSSVSNGKDAMEALDQRRWDIV